MHMALKVLSPAGRCWGLIRLVAFAFGAVLSPAASGETFDKFLLQFQPDVAARTRELVALAGMPADFEIESIGTSDTFYPTVRFYIYHARIEVGLSALGEVRTIRRRLSDSIDDEEAGHCRELSLDDVCKTAERVGQLIAPSRTRCEWEISERETSFSGGLYKSMELKFAQRIWIGDIRTYAMLNFYIDPCSGNITSLLSPCTRFPTGKEILISRDEVEETVNKYLGWRIWSSFDVEGAPLVVAKRPDMERNARISNTGTGNETQAYEDERRKRDFDHEMRIVYYVAGVIMRVPGNLKLLNLGVDAVTGEIWEVPSMVLDSVTWPIGV